MNSRFRVDYTANRPTEPRRPIAPFYGWMTLAFFLWILSWDGIRGWDAVVWCLIWAVVGYVVGSYKNRQTAGFWLGLLLQPFGILILFVVVRPRSSGESRGLRGSSS